MAKPYRIPDFRKLYPEASEEVIAVLITTERKIQYQEYDLKVEQAAVDQEGQTVTVIPSREDSYERLLEKDEQFAEDAVNVEEQAIKNIQIQQLHKALSLLSEESDPSQSLQMMSRPLMSPDELKTLLKGHFILAKTGNCPMQTRLPLFLKWGITFGDAYEVAEQAARPVTYKEV